MSLEELYKQYNFTDAFLLDMPEDSYNEQDSLAQDFNGSLYGLYDFINFVTHKEGRRLEIGSLIYAFVTPFIIGIGLIGNVISMRVFSSARLRSLSASYYLAALSASDSIVLLTYVLFHWLLRGLPLWPGGYSVNLINRQGLCQGFMFVSYVFRFISVYLIVIFTVERYIAVCRPLQRKVICTRGFAKKVITGVHVFAAVVSAYKPILSGMYSSSHSLPTQSSLESINHTETELQSNHSFAYYHQPLSINSNDTNSLEFLFHPDSHVSQHEQSASELKSEPLLGGGLPFCQCHPDYKQVDFVLDLVYGLSITALPFLMVSIFNVLMLKKLITRFLFGAGTGNGNRTMMAAVFKRSNMRIEFTITVIAVFIA